MKTYRIEITGKTPLLMHWDNIEWADYMAEWQNDPENKAASKAGDDRVPAFTWIGCVYNDGNIVTIPQENIMKCLMEGGTMVKVPGGKSGKTFKSQTQSGMMSVDPHWPLIVNDKTIPFNDIKRLMDVPKFADHKTAARKLGFDLLCKRAAIQTKKHIRVRPLFHAGWKAVGQIIAWDEQIDKRALELIFAGAGRYKGLCDWRPGAKTSPGPYGTFEARVSE